MQAGQLAGKTLKLHVVGRKYAQNIVIAQNIALKQHRTEDINLYLKLFWANTIKHKFSMNSNEYHPGVRKFSMSGISNFISIEQYGN